MQLGALVPEGGNSAVTGFALDHRKVAPGTIFGAFQGARVNGEDYIPAAIAAGAVAVVARPEAVVSGAVHVADANPRRAFAALAARFFAPFPATTVAGSRPVKSRSRLGSGTTPKGGAMRRMMLLMAGATTMPAVRKP